MRAFSSTDLANRTGDVLAAAARDAVQIKRHGAARFVMMSVERFEDLAARTPASEAVSASGDEGFAAAAARLRARLRHDGDSADLVRAARDGRAPGA